MELVQENERLKQSIEILEDMTRQDRANHAINMHEMNKGRRDLRLIMEDKLRKELAGIEISFHKEAFQALHERQKLSMFENAKLKDEVAIQGVGITNLTARLLRQQKFCEKCTKQLQVLQNKTKKLRDQLATATQHRNDITRQRDTLTKEYEALTVQSKQLLSRYNQAKSSSEYESISHQLLDKYAMTLRTWREEQAQVTLWRERLAQLTAIHLELKPTSETEQNGQYSPSLFPIFTMLEELRNGLNNISSEQQQQQQRYSVLQTTMQHLLDSNNNGSNQHQQHALQEALQPAFSRDTNLLKTVEVLADKERKLHKTHLLRTEQQLDDEERRLLQAANGAALEAEETVKDKADDEEPCEAEINGQDMIAWGVLKILTLWNRTSSSLYNHDEIEKEVQQAVMQQQLVLSTPQSFSVRSPTGTVKSAGSSIASFSPQQQKQQLLGSIASRREDDNNSEMGSYASEHTLDNINEGENEEDDDNDTGKDDGSFSNEEGGEQKEEVFDTFNPDPKSVRPVTSSDIYDDGMNRDGFDDLPAEISVSQRQSMLALSPKPIISKQEQTAQVEEEEAAAAWAQMTISPRNMQLQIETMAEEENDLNRELEYDELMFAPAALKGSASSSWLKPLPKYTTNVFVQELQSTLQPKNPLVVHADDEIMRYSKDAFEIGPPLVKHMKISSSTCSLSQQGRPLSASSGKLLSPLMQQSTRAGSSKQEAFDLSFSHDFSSVSAYQPLTAKKSNDPLLQKSSMKKAGAGSVQVSNELLRRLPKSLSTPLLRQQQQNQQLAKNSIKKSKTGRSEALLELFD